MGFETSVIVVDDHPLFRSGVVETLNDADDLTVIDEASSATEAVEKVASKRPDVLLLDLGLPGGGLEVLRQLATRRVATRTVVLTASENQTDLRESLNLGARGYVLKGVSGPQLVDIVRRVRRGEAYVTPNLATEALFLDHGSSSDRHEEESLAELTERELEVLELVAEAYGNKEIAARLEISEKTVKHHMTNIMGKLNARNRVEAALMVRRSRSASSR
ncbi:MAG TPA: response regulator transcription factor [Candidatus Sulfomarinibacteraceae bacterium]|nr:response regulator transcription factor [Candidatus Sulfomarinibacteraceae bacterium]